MNEKLPFDFGNACSFSKSVNCAVCGATGEETEVIEIHSQKIISEQVEWRFVRCTRCGTLRNDPQWQPNILKWMYDSVYYKSYHPLTPDAIMKIIQVNYRNYEAFLDELTQAADVGRMFDVGCGQALMILEAQSRGIDAYGCDFSGTNVDFVRNTLGIPNVSEGQFIYRPIWDEFFDLITFNDSIEHTPDPAEQLAIANRMMRKGGILSVTVPNCDSPLVGYNRDFFYDPPYHLWGFGRKTLRSLVENAGFEAIKMSSGNFYIGQLWCVAKKQ